MLTQIEVAWRTLRRKLSRSHWLMHWLELPQDSERVGAEAGADPDCSPNGLILVQIDGLGFGELQNAIEKGRAPFMARLLKREHYQCRPMYSGLPSSTPAVQGELFYGVKTAVPAFGFKPLGSKQMARMYDPDTARRIEEKLQDGHAPLLAGGSAYCNIYTGGARESHFCASSMGWDEVVENIKPVRWVVACLLNFPTVLRTLFFMLLEACLASIDFFRGQLNGRMFFPELKFIAARVGISVLLRDIVTESARVDMERGLLVIQLNYIGYDEQAHRRGPDSAFAHWSIKGIDRCIEKLWSCAHRTDTRHYDLWVYSDHGQECATPYQSLSGVSISNAVCTAYETITSTPTRQDQTFEQSIAHQRARLLGSGFLQKLFVPSFHVNDRQTPKLSQPSVIAMGPVGHVYLEPDDIDDLIKTQLARQLVSEHHVPAAVVVQSDQQLAVHTKSGVFNPNHHSIELFGEHHPYREEIVEDLHNLCTHDDAGHVVLLGWIQGGLDVTFSPENGSHAGLGPKETRAFALMPGDVLVGSDKYGCFRPLTLRKAAMQHLHPEPRLVKTNSRQLTNSDDGDTLKIMTYNVHSCVGMDGIASVKRIARIIALYQPDVVALQELDVGKPRTYYSHQAEQLAELLGMNCYFNPAMGVENELYGDATLSSLPMELVKSRALTDHKKSSLEPRGALWTCIEYKGGTVQLLNTHLGLSAEQRRAHVDELVGSQWLGHEKFSGPAIFCGDLNALPGSYTMNTLSKKLTDVEAGNHTPLSKKTFRSRVPLLRIDHILTSPQFEVAAVEIPNTQLTRIASDHLPLIATLRLQAV